jgi:hypothetical protein
LKIMVTSQNFWSHYEKEKKQLFKKCVDAIFSTFHSIAIYRVAFNISKLLCHWLKYLQITKFPTCCHALVRRKEIK